MLSILKRFIELISITPEEEALQFAKFVRRQMQMEREFKDPN